MNLVAGTRVELVGGGHRAANILGLTVGDRLPDEIRVLVENDGRVPVSVAAAEHKVCCTPGSVRVGPGGRAMFRVKPQQPLFVMTEWDGGSIAVGYYSTDVFLPAGLVEIFWEELMGDSTPAPNVEPKLPNKRRIMEEES